MIYNHCFPLAGIPLKAYDHVENGKPALGSVVEHRCMKTDEDSGIVIDATDMAIDAMHNPKYPLVLFMRVITVSFEPIKIVSGLLKLDMG